MSRAEALVVLLFGLISISFVASALFRMPESLIFASCTCFVWAMLVQRFRDIANKS